MALNYSGLGAMGYTELEKRQLFLRSYQFSRKQSLSHRIKKSFFRVKKSIFIRFRSARKLRKMLWLKLKNGLFRRRRFFLRLHNSNYNYNYYYYHTFSSPQSSSFWGFSIKAWTSIKSFKLDFTLFVFSAAFIRICYGYGCLFNFLRYCKDYLLSFLYN